MLNAWSWEGEDILARKVMIDRFGITKGFYVDVGAHHPFNLSNTALLHSEGWHGINIDATPGSMQEFRKHRPEDINLEIAIAPEHGDREFIQFRDNPGLNGFLSPESVVHRSGEDCASRIATSSKRCRSTTSSRNTRAPHPSIS